MIYSVHHDSTLNAITIESLLSPSVRLLLIGRKSGLTVTMLDHVEAQWKIFRVKRPIIPDIIRFRCSTWLNPISIPSIIQGEGEGGRGKGREEGGDTPPLPPITLN